MPLLNLHKKRNKQQTRSLYSDPAPYCGEGGSTELLNLMVLKGLSLYTGYSKLRSYVLHDLGQMTQPPSADGYLVSRVSTPSHSCAADKSSRSDKIIERLRVAQLTYLS